MTFEEYGAIKGVNWSSLKHMQVSPRMYRWRLAHPENKPAFALGNAAHCAILEPDAFEQRYAEYAPVRNGAKWEAWQAEHPGVQSLKPDEMAEAKEIAKEVRGHRIAAKLLRGGRSEESITWTDEATGLTCKARVDYLRPDLLLDLKTARDPSPEKFERDAFSFGYASQVAFYHDGATRARLIDGRERPYIIAVRKGDDFDVACFQVKSETLEVGRVIYRRLLRRLAECMDADYWPGVAPDLQHLGLPPWAANQDFVEEEDF